MDVQRFYTSGVAYDQEYLGYNPDIDFLVWLARTYAKGGRVFNACCGTLREGIPLARVGAQEDFSIVGVDITPAMLDYGRGKLSSEPIEVREAISLVLGDIRTVDVGYGTYDLVFVPFNSFLHLTTQEDQIMALSNLRKHLKSEKGVFLVDIFNPDITKLSVALGPNFLREERVVEDKDMKELLVRIASTSYVPATQMMKVRFYFQVYELNQPGTLKRHFYSPVELRVIYPAELELLLRLAGLEAVERWGNYARDPFGDKSGQMLFLTKPA